MKFQSLYKKKKNLNICTANSIPLKLDVFMPVQNFGDSQDGSSIPRISYSVSTKIP